MSAPASGRPPFDDADAWHVLAPLLEPYLPWSNGALRPAGLVTVLNDVWFRTPALVVELGSGASTVVVARLLKELGSGRLLAVEHDETWAERVQRQLAHEDLAEVASVVRAPLRPHQRSWDGAEWYDETVVVAAMTRVDLPIDVLVVDGPPAYRPGTAHARYPALGLLAEWLAPDATVVLDDVERPGEQAVLARWREEHAITFDLRPDAGIAIGRWEGQA